MNKTKSIEIISIGDIAGKQCWKDIRHEEYDFIVFHGDLPDPRDGIKPSQVVNNLEDIIEAKKQNPDKYILLLGNHDASYLYLNDESFKCNPHDSSIERTLHKMYKGNVDLFQIAFQVDNYLFTHAGITNEWWKMRSMKSVNDIDNRRFHKDSNPELTNSNFLEKRESLSLKEHHEKYDTTIADTINAIWKKDKYSIAHVSTWRGGWDPHGGPLWLDSNEIKPETILPGYHQVCGHNRVEDFVTIRSKNDPENTSLTFVDVLDYQIKFYEIIIPK